MAQLTFWYEFASTYSYLSAMRIESLAQAHGVTVRWRPFLLGVVFREMGWPVDSPFNWQQAKGKHMWRDMERLSAERGLGFVRPDPFPQSGLLASRVVLAVGENAAEKVPELSRAIFLASFTENAQLADPETLAHCLKACDLDPTDYLERASTPGIKMQLGEHTDEAREMGIFGAPSFVTAQGELFWGDDRLDQAIHWAAKEA